MTPIVTPLADGDWWRSVGEWSAGRARSADVDGLATVPDVEPSAEVIVWPITCSAWDSDEVVSSELQRDVGLHLLLDARNGRELGDRLGRVHRLGRILVLHLGDQQGEKLIVVHGRRLQRRGAGRGGTRTGWEVTGE